MYLCLTCKSDEACINHRAIPENENFDLPCPKPGCPGVLLDLDDGIAEAVAILNDKGYPTKDSCGGHFNNADDILSCYVVFEPGRAPAAEPPRGFVWAPEGSFGSTIAGDTVFLYDGNHEIPAAFFTESNRTIQVLDANRRLLEWAINLPACPQP